MKIKTPELNDGNHFTHPIIRYEPQSTEDLIPKAKKMSS